MSTSTTLLLNNQWSIESIETIIEKRLGLKIINTKPNTGFSFSSFTLQLLFNTDIKKISIHLNSNTPLGTATQLIMSQDNENILKSIAAILGGYLVTNNNEETGQMFKGLLDSNDNLQHFLNHSVIDGKSNGNSIPELNEYIKKWKRETGMLDNITTI